MSLDKRYESFSDFEKENFIVPKESWIGSSCKEDLFFSINYDSELFIIFMNYKSYYRDLMSNHVRDLSLYFRKQFKYHIQKLIKYKNEKDDIGFKRMLYSLLKFLYHVEDYPYVVKNT